MRVLVLSIHPIYDNRINKHLRTLRNHGIDLKYFNASQADSPGRLYALENPQVVWIKKAFSKKQPFSALFLLLRMALFILQEKAEIVHIHDALLLPLSAIAKLAGKKIIYDRHESYELIGGSNAEVGSLFEKIFLRLTDGVIIVAESQLNFIAKLGVRKYCIVPNYQPIALYSAERESISNKTRIVYLGTLDNSSRNIDFMFDFIEDILRKSQNVEFHIAGRIIGTEIQGRIGLLKNDNRFKYLGVIDYAQVVEETLRADIGMYFVRDIPNNYYSSPNKIYEYMISGCPVIAMGTFMHMEEIGREAGLVFDFGTKLEHVVARTIELLEDKKRMAMLKKRAKEIGRKYCWESVEKEYVKIYLEVLKGKRSGLKRDSLTE